MSPRPSLTLYRSSTTLVCRGEYAINFVQGFQRAQEAPDLLQASACCKHYVANELEGWNGTDRHKFNAVRPVTRSQESQSHY